MKEICVPLHGMRLRERKSKGKPWSARKLPFEGSQEEEHQAVILLSVSPSAAPEHIFNISDT
jgi:hypothetical protein